MSRRSITHLFRVLVSVCGAALVLFVWRGLPAGLERGDLAHVGRYVFEMWRVLVLGASAALGPISVALGVQEERDGGTLDILALSKISPGALFTGVILARVGGVVLSVLGSVPILALAFGLGGFSALEVFETIVFSFTLLCLLPVLTAHFALAAKHPILPVLGAWLWVGLTYSVLFFVLWVLGGMANTLLLNPAAAFAEERTLLPSLVLILGFTFVFGRLGGTVLDIALSQDESDSFGALHPEVWRLVRVRQRAWMAFLACVFFLAIVRLFDRLQWTILDVLQFVGVLVGIVSGGIILFFLIFDQMLGLGRTQRVRSAEAIRRGLIGEPDIGWSPILWRDLQFGGSTARLSRALGGLGLLAVVPISAWMGIELLMIYGIGFYLVTGTLLSVSAALEEARVYDDTLALAPLSASTLVTHKAVATPWLLWPFWAGFTGISLGAGLGWNGCYMCERTSLLDWVVSVLPTAAWVVFQPMWIGVVALWIAVRFGTRAVWPSLLGVAGVALILSSAPVPLLNQLGQLFFPVMEEPCWHQPGTWTVNLLVQGGVTVLFGGLAARALTRRGRS